MISKRKRVKVSRREREQLVQFSEVSIPKKHISRDISGASSQRPNGSTLPINLFILPKKDQSLFSNNHLPKKFGANQDVWRVSVSPDQEKFAIGCWNGDVLFYHTQEESGDFAMHDFDQTHQCYPGPHGRRNNPVSALEFAPDGSFLVVSWERGFVISFDTKTGKIIYEIDTRNVFVTSLCISNGCDRLVIGGYQGWEIFPINDNMPTKVDFMLNEKRDIRTICFSPDNTKLCVGCYEGCFIYDGKGSKLLLTLCQDQLVLSSAFSPDGMLIAIGCKGSAAIFDVATGCRINSYKDSGSFFLSLQFSHDGTRIYFLCPRDRKIACVDLMSGVKEQNFYCPNDIEDVALGPNNTLLAACGNHGGHLFNTEVFNNELKHDDEGKFRNAVVEGSGISKDYRFMAMTFGLKGFKMYSTVSKKELYYQHCCADSICFSPVDSNVFAIGGDLTVLLFDAEKYGITNLEIKHRKSHIKSTPPGDSSQSFQDDDEIIQSSDSDWRSRIDDLFFSWDGQYICSIIDGKNIVLNTTSDGREILTLQSNFEYKGCATFIPSTNTNILFVNEASFLSFYQVSNVGVTNLFSFNIERKISAFAFTSDGKFLLLCVDKDLLSFEFNISHGIDPSAPSHLMSLGELVINQIKVSPDDQFAVISAANSILVCGISEALSEVKLEKLYEINLFGEFRSMCFRPRSEKLGTNQLSVTYRLSGKNLSRIFDIIADVNPTFCHSILEGNDIETTLPIFLENGQALLQRDEGGDTFLSAAIKGPGREIHFDLVHELVKRFPRYALALIPPSKNEFPGVIACLANKNYLTSVDALFTSGDFSPYTSEIELVRIRDNVLPTLIDKHAVDSLEKFFDAGTKDFIAGYVPGATSYYLDKPKSIFTSKFLNQLRLEASRVSSIGNLPPQTSPFPADLSVFSNFDQDPNKKIKLKQMRVLFPGLANLSTLEWLLNDQSPDKSAMLKLFQKESLQTSIDANWESWAKTIFMRQFFWYLFLLLSITLLTFINDKHEIVQGSLYAAAFIGLLFFLRLFLIRCISCRSVAHLLINAWNGLQATFLTSAFTFIVLDLRDYSFEARYICAAFAQLFGWINILYYARGNEDIGWIVYALIRVIWKMLRFVMILSHIVFAFTLFFFTLELSRNGDTYFSFNFKVDEDCGQVSFWNGLGNVFLQTFATAMLSDIDLTEYTATILQLVINVLVVVVICLICLNAMIAFVSEEFADVLSDKDAVLAREKASILVDIYSCMDPAFRRKLENENKWVYKLVPITSLERINEGSNVGISKSLANRRATKSDIVNTRLALKAEAEQLQKQIKEVHTGLKVQINDTFRENVREAIGSEHDKIKSKLAEQFEAESEALKFHNAELKAEMTEIKGMLVELLSK